MFSNLKKPLEKLRIPQKYTKFVTFEHNKKIISAKT